MPKINGNELRSGNVINHNGGLWQCMKVQHVKPGKGGAFAQVELRNLRNNSKLNERFRSADKVERVRLEQREQQFLYESDAKMIFMDLETYDQIELDNSLLGERRPFLVDGMTVQIEYFEEEALSVQLPEKVKVKIEDTEPSIKGQTATSSFKPAKLENGIRIMVPQFLNTHEEVIVSTETFEYVERA